MLHVAHTYGVPSVLLAARTPLTRLALSDWLERSGFAVTTATAGREALDACLWHPGEVDVLLVEAGLPDLPAPAFYARLKAQLPDQPCCFFAGPGSAHLADRAREMGATALNWPVQTAALASSLLAAIAAML